ncbi:MAG: phytanoyl-CoA dioxygenase family protein [Acidimicrobiales bacterium]
MSSSATTDVAAIAERITDQGWAIVPDVIDADAVAALSATVDATMAADDTPFGVNTFLGERTRRVFNLLSHDPAYAAVPTDPTVLPIVEAVLDHELLLSSLTAIETHPGQGPQPLHADDGSIPLPRPHPPLAVIALWALSDFTEENGATRFVPGTHLESRRPRPGEEATTVSAEMSAGSVLIYNGSLWHGGGANLSEGRRQFIVCNYCAGWVRQEESQLLGLDRDYVATLPPRMRRLVGYGVYKGLIGHVAGDDPGSWVDDDVETDLVWKRMR